MPPAVRRRRAARGPQAALAGRHRVGLPRLHAGRTVPAAAGGLLRAGGPFERTAFKTFGNVEALHLEAADDPPTRDAIVERVLGCERTALSAEAQQRLARALVTGAA